MKMSRRKIRETIFLMLFRLEFNTKEELLEQLDWYFTQQPDSGEPEDDTSKAKKQKTNNADGDEYLPLNDISEEDETYIRTKLEKILDHIEDLDQTIVSICEGWNLSRLGKAEFAILRLATYEIQYDDDIPTGVAINEAVELAKTYCSKEAPRFINGVLAKLA